MLLPTGGPMAQVRRLGPKVSWKVGSLVLFCIYCMNRVNSLLMMSAP